MLSAEWIISIIGAYFLVLILVARLTGKKGSNSEFFTGDRSSRWYLVAFGMIGASLSGVTFVSVTGGVHKGGFSYFQIVLGYLIGYVLIAYVLLPLYYRLNLTSIYEYLGKRFGFWSYKTGAIYFLISRLAGSSIRLLMVAEILQVFVFDKWGIPFAVTIAISVGLIWLYTQRGGIRTIVYTDTLQTTFMLLAAVITFYMIADGLDFSGGELIKEVFKQDYSKVWFTDPLESSHWLKMILAGALIAFCMTGLDQDMMQKNLTCRNLKDAQKNVLSFSVVLVFVNLFFLILGGALAYYADAKELPITMTDGVYKADEIFPYIALNDETGTVVGVFFILGLIAAAYSSADSALTALTTSLSVDILNINQYETDKSRRLRKRVHVVMSLMVIATALILHPILDQSAIENVFYMAGLTYGPLLGLFLFGIITKRNFTTEWLVLPICIVVPVLCFFLGKYDTEWFGGFNFGSELLGINGLLTFAMLWIISSRRQTSDQEPATSLV